MKMEKHLPLTYTYSEVFIIESLALIDEEEGRFEGKILFDILKMCGKNPKYYYFRTQDELYMLMDKFKESRYRFLHLSCHGSDTEVHTTIDNISYPDFSSIISGQLKNRRLFISACELGNHMFCSLIAAKNQGIYSISAPTRKINFDHACAFWTAFYVKIFNDDRYYMKNKNITSAMKKICSLYKLEFHWCWWNHKKYDHTTIK